MSVGRSAGKLATGTVPLLMAEALRFDAPAALPVKTLFTFVAKSGPLNVFVPVGLAGPQASAAALGMSLLAYLAKLLALSAAVVLVETTNAKMRLFRVPDLLSAAFVLATLALLSTFLFH